MPRILGFLLISCLSLIPQLTHAVEAQQDPRVANAKTACAAGDVQQAIHLLAELYTATNDPIWIFNQGRCYHQNNLLPQAMARFKEFLRKNTNGPADDSRDAQTYINEIEAEQLKSQVQSASPTVAGPTAPTAGSAPVVQVQSQPPPARQEGRVLRLAGIASVAFGGACLISGVIFSVLKSQAESDVEAQTQSGIVPYASVSGRFSDGRTYADLQWVGYGLGAGAVITGGLLYYFGARKAAAASGTTLVAPLLVAGGAGAVLSQSF